TAFGSDTDAEIDQQPGGSAANMAAWLGVAGADVAFVGRAGRGAAGRHAAALRAHGVDAQLASDPHLPTAAIVLLVDPAGERTMYVDRGANANLRLDDVATWLWDGLGWLHLTGYSFFDPRVRPVAAELLRRAVAAGVPVSVDPSSAAYLDSVGAPDFLSWVRGASLLVPNAHEAQVLTGVRDPVEAGRRLAGEHGEVVVTCGAQGAVSCRATGAPVRQPPPQVDVVDTTGAGDAFCAGLLAAGMRGADVRARLAAGAELSGRAVGRLGARPPTR
ncbi:MAG: PfkB family carbohydrate kinase, partial [Actinomycetota bacterium]|nr:PfkB family carbohydrate kinase [Actinomycetota bacterium]